MLRNKAVLRGLEKNPDNPCGREYMWDGISVEGDPGAPEGSLYQGVVEIIDGATIQDARCGMRLDSRTWYNNQPPQPDPPSNTEQWDRGRLSYPDAEGHGGGSVYGVHANFLNNRKDVEFLPYTYMNNMSGFVSCVLVVPGH